MGDWWQQNIVDAGKLPLLLCAASFVVTFLATRAITRMIRAGRGPFRDNVSASGTHVHHAVYGVVLLVLGALVAVGSNGSPYRELAAVAVGAGTSLVLDEFALILHLQDVYWAQEGRLSVEMVSLTAGCLAFALIGVLPLGIGNVGSTEQTVRGSLAAILVVHALVVILCAAKGKYRTALVAMFVPLAGWAGAIRLARPGSLWARRWYRGARLERAEQRARRFDSRWDPLGDWFTNLIGGAPSLPNPPAPGTPRPAHPGAPSPAAAGGSNAALPGGSRSAGPGGSRSAGPGGSNGPAPGAGRRGGSGGSTAGVPAEAPDGH